VGSDNPDLVLLLNNKTYVREFVAGLNFPLPQGSICDNVESLAASYLNLKRATGTERFVIKRPYGSSGSGFYHVFGDKDFSAIYSRIRGMAGVSEKWIIEEWQNTTMCLNAQLFVDPQDSRVLAITQQFINPLGVYQGSDLLPILPPPITEVYGQYLQDLMRVIAAMGYKGFLGVDSYINSDGQLIPVIEINARMTLVTYLLDLREHLIGEQNKSILYRIYKFSVQHMIEFDSFWAGLKKLVNKANCSCMLLHYSCVRTENARDWLYSVHLLYFGSYPRATYTVMKQAERYMNSREWM
jgi:[BtrI acyl-carrier protein]--L-glutamate ligase